MVKKNRNIKKPQANGTMRQIVEGDCKNQIEAIPGEKPSVIGWHIGKYIAQEDISNGPDGMGKVLVCTYGKEDIVVLKACNLFDEELLKLFEKEVDNWINLKPHPNIVTAYTVFKHTVPIIGERRWLVLEYIGGYPDSENTVIEAEGNHARLNNNFRQHIGRSSLPIIIGNLLDISNGMIHVGKSKISAHGDLRPENILITHNGRAKITDFGLSGMTNQRYHSGIYTAPEVKEGGTPNAKSDIYSFGAIIKTDVLCRIKELESNEILYLELSNIVRECLHKKPEDRLRFTNFEEISRTLNDLYKQIPGGEKRLQTSETDEAGILLNKARGLYSLLETTKQPKYEPILNLLKRAKTLAPKNPSVHLALGLIYTKQNKMEKAVEAYKHAIKLNPNEGFFYNSLGNALLKLGKRESAIANYKKAQKLSCDSEISKNLGMALAQTGKIEEAVTAFKYAIELSPNKAAFYTELGKALFKLGKWEEAKTACEKATKLNPRDASAYLIEGTALYRNKDLERAAKAYEKAIELTSKDALAWIFLSATLYNLGKPEESAEKLYTARNIAPNEASYRYNLGTAFFELGMLDKSAEAYREAIQLDSKNAETYNNLGIVLLEIGEKSDLEEAIEVFKAAIILNPQRALFLNNLGDALCKLGKPERAIQVYYTAVEYEPNSVTYIKLARTLIKLGHRDNYFVPNFEDERYKGEKAIELVRQGYLEEAIDACKNAIELNPADAAAYTVLGNAITDLGYVHTVLKHVLTETSSTEEAAKAYYKAVALEDPKNAETHANLGDALVKLNKLEEAVKAYSTAAEVTQKPAIYIKLGDTLSKLNNFKDAVKAYNEAVKLDTEHSNYIKLGDALIKLGNLEEAIVAYYKHLEYEETYNIYKRLGSPLAKLGRLEETVTAYNKTLQLAPPTVLSYEFYIKLGAALSTLEKSDEAIATLEKALQLSPSKADFYTILGSAFAEHYNYIEATKAYNSAIELNPNHAATRAHLGFALSKQNKTYDAIAAYKKAIELNTEDATVYANMGNAFYELGNMEKCISSYHNSLKINPKQAATYNNLGMALYKKKDFKAAIQAYHESLKLPENHDATITFIGGLPFAQAPIGRLIKHKEAERAYNNALKTNTHCITYTNLGMLYTNLNNKLAIVAAVKAIEINPEYAPAYTVLREALTNQENLKTLVDTYYKAVTQDPCHASRYDILGVGLSKRGKLQFEASSVRKQNLTLYRDTIETGIKFFKEDKLEIDLRLQMAMLNFYKAGYPNHTEPLAKYDIDTSFNTYWPEGVLSYTALEYYKLGIYQAELHDFKAAQRNINTAWLHLKAKGQLSKKDNRLNQAIQAFLAATSRNEPYTPRSDWCLYDDVEILLDGIHKI